MNIVSDFFVFIFRPSKEGVVKTKTIWNKIMDLIILLISETGLILAITFITHLLINSGIVISPQHHFSNADKGGFALILVVAIIAPLMEEITFRGWLVYNRFLVAFFPAVLFVYWVSPYVFHQELFVDMINTSLSFFIGVVLFLSTYFILKKTELNFIKLWNRKTRMLLLISVVLFGYLHILNYNITPNLVLFSPIILLPFIISGLIIGYIRIKMGFLWGLSYHVIKNLIPVLITIILK